MTVPYKSLPDFEAIKANRKTLDECKKHKFEWNNAIHRMIDSKLHCANCGGKMRATEAYQYALGYEAAGGNPNDIIEGFR